jgi:LPXTG-motif cell wall-anchored protein
LGETWIYEATGTADQAQYANTATVDGNDIIDEQAVSDTDPSNYQMVISATGGDFSLAPYAVGVILLGLGLLVALRMRRRHN